MYSISMMIPYKIKGANNFRIYGTLKDHGGVTTHVTYIVAIEFCYTCTIWEVVGRHKHPCRHAYSHVALAHVMV